MLAALASAPLSALNVYGDELALCSKPGMAMTGFTRDGHCTDLDDDAGSHHICIQMWPSKVNFCNQTGQPDWCEEEMPCHEDASKTCPIKNWCVCQWAFEAYVQKVGCDAVVDLQCEAVNKVALDAYEEDKDAHKEALACLKLKCPDIPSGAKSSRTAVSSLQPLAHHDTASEACATCATANPNVDCYSGYCGDGSGKYCWWPQTDANEKPPTGYSKCAAAQHNVAAAQHNGTAAQHSVVLVARSSRERRSAEEACATCATANPSVDCYSGYCGDGDGGKYCEKEERPPPWGYCCAECCGKDCKNDLLQKGLQECCGEYCWWPQTDANEKPPTGYSKCAAAQHNVAAAQHNVTAAQHSVVLVPWSSREQLAREDTQEEACETCADYSTADCHAGACDDAGWTRAKPSPPYGGSKYCWWTATCLFNNTKWWRCSGGGGPPVLPPAGSPGLSGYLVAAPAPSTAALSADARPPAAFSKCAAAPRGGAKGSPHSAAAQHVLQAR